jgi:glucose/arabinose dehydrogenase
MKQRTTSLLICAVAIAACAFAAAALETYHITPASLPKPEPTPTKNGPKQIAKPADASLTLPSGFQASVFAEGEFQQPRGLLQAANGDVFLTDSRAGNIVVLRDADQDGRVDAQSVFASGLNRPYGLALWQDFLYVGNTDAVVRFTYKPGQQKSEGEAEKIADLPWAKTGHWTRTLAFSPDGRKLYVGIGSSSNVDVETDPMRATIFEFNPDGSGKRMVASGTRNPTAVLFHPRSRKLWAAVQERDLIGDDLVPDYVTEVKDGGFYGWPFAYIGPNEDPRRKGEQPDLVKKTLVPDVLIQAHSAVLGAAFGSGTMFPADYRDDLYVALHGSWNRSQRTGYKIIRVPFKGDRAAGGYEDFVVGWMLGPDRPEVWGRPVGVAFLKDGSMLVTDDGANKVWRIAYSGRTR